jgi:regulator of sirC expression with transglutaminase-like and TPR domain
MNRNTVRERFAEAARAERPDLALLCLLIGGEADPDTGEHEVDSAQIEIDRLTGLLPHATRRTPEGWARALARLLGEQEGFRGGPGDYQRLESSLLGEVLRRHRGLPILLSVVWIEVARRACAPVYGVALPGHFVVGFGDPGGDHVHVDPFSGGRLLGERDVGLLVAGAAGTPLSASMLCPADPLEIVLRILNNIRVWASARPERSDVQLWAVELSLLLPHHPARLRYERARLLVDRGDFMTGARELEEYANAVAALKPTAAETVRREAHAARARLN